MPDIPAPMIAIRTDNASVLQRSGTSAWSEQASVSHSFSSASASSPAFTGIGLSIRRRMESKLLQLDVNPGSEYRGLCQQLSAKRVPAIKLTVLAGAGLRARMSRFSADGRADTAKDELKRERDSHRGSNG